MTQNLPRRASRTPDTCPVTPVSPRDVRVVSTNMFTKPGKLVSTKFLQIVVFIFCYNVTM